MDVTLSELLGAFMESPLVVWVSPQRSSGVFICLHSDPSPTNQRLNNNMNNDVSLRLHNLTVLTRHIRTHIRPFLRSTNHSRAPAQVNLHTHIKKHITHQHRLVTPRISLWERCVLRASGST
uniref:Uncharacterized protein n=1 Tax=Neolamprologus brichardi TaxID=32507 RepID=A0A3Q4GPE2_NEOBR